MADLYHKGVLKTFDYQVKNEAFSASEYLMWMSLIDSTPENWKVADEAANNVTDYRINVSFIHCLPQKRYIRFSLKKVFIPPTAKKWIQNEFNVCLMENISSLPLLATGTQKGKRTSVQTFKHVLGNKQLFKQN